MPRAGLSRTGVVAVALTVVDDGGARGFEDLTLAAVAARAGVATPSLYKHVAGLSDLKQEVAIVCVDELTERLTQAAVGRSGGEALRRLAEAYRGFALASPGRYAATQVAPSAVPGDGGGGDRDGGGGRRASWTGIGDGGAGIGDARARWAASSSRTVTVVGAVLHGCGVAPGRTVDAIRTVRSALHGFVSLELGGGFGLPDDVARSFAFLVRSLEAGIRESVHEQAPA